MFYPSGWGWLWLRGSSVVRWSDRNPWYGKMEFCNFELSFVSPQNLAFQTIFSLWTKQVSSETLKNPTLNVKSWTFFFFLIVGVIILNFCEVGGFLRPNWGGLQTRKCKRESTQGSFKKYYLCSTAAAWAFPSYTTFFSLFFKKIISIYVSV